MYCIEDNAYKLPTFSARHNSTSTHNINIERVRGVEATFDHEGFRRKGTNATQRRETICGATRHFACVDRRSSVILKTASLVITNGCPHGAVDSALDF